MTHLRSVVTSFLFLLRETRYSERVTELEIVGRSNVALDAASRGAIRYVKGRANVIRTPRFGNGLRFSGNRDNSN